MQIVKAMEGPSIYLAAEQLRPFVGRRVRAVDGNSRIGTARLHWKTVSDIFAWGCTVGYAASGRLPYGEGAPNVLLYRVLKSNPDIDFGRLSPPLRSLDAIHLVAALALGSALSDFVAYDQRVMQAATWYRLPVSAPT